LQMHQESVDILFEVRTELLLVTVPHNTE
jgi:hypothetical protein